MSLEMLKRLLNWEESVFLGHEQKVFQANCSIKELMQRFRSIIDSSKRNVFLKKLPSYRQFVGNIDEDRIVLRKRSSALAWLIFSNLYQLYGKVYEDKGVAKIMSSYEMTLFPASRRSSFCEHCINISFYFSCYCSYICYWVLHNRC